MINEVDLLKKYNQKGVLYGDELIILKEFCEEFIASCEHADLAIIGIEGFYLFSDGNIMPNLDEITDFSEINSENWYTYLQQCISASRKFVNYMLRNGKSDGYCFSLMNNYEFEKFHTSV